MNPRVIAVVGGKKSGKTTTIELLVKELTGRGYRIAAVKHIPEPNFTIDEERKDTWKYAQAGATTIIAVSSQEIATIEKVPTASLSLKKILQKCKGNDLVFLEGFRDLVVNDSRIDKILVINSAEEAAKDMKIFHPIVAMTGPVQPRIGGQRIPYVNVMRNPKKLADLVERTLLKRAEKRVF
jgi:molybdopterin-guanine dinucleotide biosynthesis protein MobB